MLSIIATLNKPDSGDIYFNDTILNSLDNDALALFRNRSFGFVFQNANMIPYLNVAQNILLPLEYGKIDSTLNKTKLVEELLHSLKLDGYAQKPINHLSGGEQQRVAIARALINNPDIIFADEPTGNLDATNTLIILDKLKEISKQKNKIVILVTHDPLVSQYSNRTIELQKL